MSPELLDVVGYAAASLTTAAFFPQLLRVWRTRSAEDISALMYSMFIAGLVLWIAYGLLMSAWPIVIANVLTVTQAIAILWMKWRFTAAQASA